MVRCDRHNSTDLTSKEVATILGKNYRTILRWIKSGLFKNAYKCEHCGAYIVPSLDVDAYIESLKT